MPRMLSSHNVTTYATLYMNAVSTLSGILANLNQLMLLSTRKHRANLLTTSKRFSCVERISSPSSVKKVMACFFMSAGSLKSAGGESQPLSSLNIS